MPKVRSRKRGGGSATIQYVNTADGECRIFPDTTDGLAQATRCYRDAQREMRLVVRHNVAMELEEQACKDGHLLGVWCAFERDSIDPRHGCHSLMTTEERQEEINWIRETHAYEFDEQVWVERVHAGGLSEFIELK